MFRSASYNRINTTSIFLLAIICLVASCSKKAVATTPPVVVPPTVKDTLPALSTVRSWLVDRGATEQTAALFYNLKKIAKTNILFGHQDATKRGVTNSSTQWANEQQFSGIAKDRSDVKEITGVYPAVYGSDFLQFVNFSSGAWFEYEKQVAHDLTVEAYNRGGVNTYCWHYANPVSKGSFNWEQSPVEAVSKILPGGTSHEVYRNSLRQISEFAKSLTGIDGKLAPVVFRPFHEFDGDWFWWGKAHCTAADYKRLYQFTVTYLRDSMGVHNFLYAWSPDRNFSSQSEYLERYPGDAYVDVVGTDNYWDLTNSSSPAIAGGKLKIVSDYGKAQNKVAAMTETGSTDNLVKSDWYTGTLLKVLTTNKLELAYVMAWANTKNSFYTPYKGHPAEADFIKFKNDPYLVFGDKLPAMYQLK